MLTRQRRATLLHANGADGSTCNELLAYAENRFTQPSADALARLPLEDEAFVVHWDRSLDEAAGDGVFAALRHRLPQLRFPIEHGMSGNSTYARATRSGLIERVYGALRLERPRALRLQLCQSAAGRIPVISSTCRADFEALVRALTHRNEPAQVPASMGACLVSGHPNWDLVADIRREWQASAGTHDVSDVTWRSAFRDAVANGRPYQDRFILASDGPYSGVPAERLGFSNDAWRELSFTIRIAHECTHYLTRRVFGRTTNALLDELIADYGGLVAAIGHFSCEWFLEFMGISDGASVRSEGRLQNYRGTPPLSDAAFHILPRIVFNAAHNVERFDRTLPAERGVAGQVAAIGALASCSLEELASADAPQRLADKWLQLTRAHVVANASPD